MILNRFKRIVKWIINILTILLVFILALVIYGKLSLSFSKNKYPNYFGWTLFEVASGSMQPTLNINDVVLVKLTQEDLKKDDIIAFEAEDAIITHRIIYMDNDTITVKGDSNNVVDKPIKINQVIGKVIKIYPKLGVWKKVIQDPKILIGIFITLLLFDYALSYNGKDKKVVKKEIKKEKPTKEEEPIIIQKIVLEKDEKEAVKKEKTDSEKLLEITRKIDIEDINKLIEGTELELSKKEVETVQEEIKTIKNDEDLEEKKEKLNEKEKEFLDWTMRLDLNEIQKRIDKKIR